MKIINGENITIILNNFFIKNIDINKKEEIEKLIKKINKNYNIGLYGYYDVIIYIDKNYGIIINIKKEELEYIDYYSEILGMNIEIIKSPFLYKVEDYFFINNTKNKYLIRKYKDFFYLELNNPSNIDLGIILENAEIAYGKIANKIRNRGLIIK